MRDRLIDIATWMWIGAWIVPCARDSWRLFSGWKWPALPPAPKPEYRREERAILLSNGKYAHVGVRGRYTEEQLQAELDRQLREVLFDQHPLRGVH